MAVDIDSLKQRLERKATFQAAVQELTEAMQQQSQSSSSTDELLPLVARCHTLLKARYSNPSFWRLGRSLFDAALAASSGSSSSNSSNSTVYAKLPGYLEDADSFLAADIEQPAGRQQTLGELLLGLPPPQEAPSHLSDAGLVLDAQAAIAVSGTAPPLTPLLQPPEAAGASEPQLEQLMQQLQQQMAGPASDPQQQQQQQQQQQEEPGMQADEQARLIELLAGQLSRGELEALLQSMTEGGGSQHQAKPAASKRVVASLPVLQLSDEAALATVGGPGTSCPVCTEALVLQDSVQQLPCKHVFHVPCLSPWLQQNNSCPVCRHELPTDDHAYEARKEREAEEAEAQRGAANALSHNEFMFT